MHFVITARCSCTHFHFYEIIPQGERCILIAPLTKWKRWLKCSHPLTCIYPAPTYTRRRLIAAPAILELPYQNKT